MCIPREIWTTDKERHCDGASFLSKVSSLKTDFLQGADADIVSSLWGEKRQPLLSLAACD